MKYFTAAELIMDQLSYNTLPPKNQLRGFFVNKDLGGLFQGRCNWFSGSFKTFLTQKTFFDKLFKTAGNVLKKQRC